MAKSRAAFFLIGVGSRHMGSAPASVILELAMISVTHLFLFKSMYKDLFGLLVFFFSGGSMV